MRIDNLFPYKFSRFYWYSQGSIVHFGHQYYREYGFWKVEGGIIVRVDMNGEAILPLETQKIPENPRGWHLHHVIPSNMIVQPMLVEFNRLARIEYDKMTDEMCMENDRIQDEAELEKKRKEEEWIANATPLMKKMRYFDWAHHQMDRPSDSLHKEEDEIIAELESLPYIEAFNLWTLYGGYDTSGCDKPDFRKCEGFEYPDLAVIAYTSKEMRGPNLKWTIISRNRDESIIYEGPARRFNFEPNHLEINLHAALKRGDVKLDTPIFSEGRQWSTMAQYLNIKTTKVAA